MRARARVLNKYLDESRSSGVICRVLQRADGERELSGGGGGGARSRSIDRHPPVRRPAVVRDGDDDGPVPSRPSIDKIVVSRSSIATTRRLPSVRPPVGSPPGRAVPRGGRRLFAVVATHTIRSQSICFSAPTSSPVTVLRILHPVKSPPPPQSTPPSVPAAAAALKYCRSMKFTALFDYSPRYAAAAVCWPRLPPLGTTLLMCSANAAPASDTVRAFRNVLSYLYIKDRKTVEKLTRY